MTRQDLKPVAELPRGAVRVHFGSIERAWKPRGSLEKNSLSADLLERLELNQQFWTDEGYGDSLEDHEAAEKLVDGVRAEVEIAVEEFLRRVFGI